MSVTQEHKQKQPSHLYKNLRFQAIPVSPSEAETPLQIVCFFDQTKNQTYAGGTELVNNKFDGAIQRLRSEDHFRGELFETLLLIPAQNQIPAKRLLLIGLGDPQNFAAETMRKVGHVAMNEAIKLGVSSFSFAPSIKDAGVSSVPAGEVSTLLAEGMLKAYSSALVLANQSLIPQVSVNEVIFLAGAAHIQGSQAGLEKAIKAAS